jgi:hypothetical protein
MKMLFEDGELMSLLLGLGVIPYTSQLIFELHYSPSSDKYSVAMIYNWQEIPIPGPCNNNLRCGFSTFLDYIVTRSLNSTDYTKTCGYTPR